VFGRSINITGNGRCYEPARLLEYRLKINSVKKSLPNFENLLLIRKEGMGYSAMLAKVFIYSGLALRWAFSVGFYCGFGMSDRVGIPGARVGLALR
jgi:hypothetical protein